MKKIISIILLVSLVASMALVVNAGSKGKKMGDVKFVQPGSIVVDGVMEPVYKESVMVGVQGIAENSPNNNTNGSTCKTYVLWDGIYLYFLSEVKDNSAMCASSLQDYIFEGGCWVDCVEYFIAWQNGDCPGAVIWSPDTMPDVNQYRAVPTILDPSLGGYWCNCYEEEQGFGTYADFQMEFKDEPGFITAGAWTKTASGYITETKIKLAKTDKLGGGNYTYGQGTKIGLLVQFFDNFGTYAHAGTDLYIGITDPEAISADDLDLNATAPIQTAWDPSLYWYVELEGPGDVVTDAPETDAPATDAPAVDTPATDAPATDAPAVDTPADDTPATDAPATQAPVTQKPADNPAPQTSDVAVAGIAVIATLALAGVAIAKKAR